MKIVNNIVRVHYRIIGLYSINTLLVLYIIGCNIERVSIADIMYCTMKQQGRRKTVHESDIAVQHIEGHAATARGKRAGRPGGAGSSGSILQPEYTAWRGLPRQCSHAAVESAGLCRAQRDSDLERGMHEILREKSRARLAC